MARLELPFRCQSANFPDNRPGKSNQRTQHNEFSIPTSSWGPLAMANWSLYHKYPQEKCPQEAADWGFHQPLFLFPLAPRFSFDSHQILARLRNFHRALLVKLRLGHDFFFEFLVYNKCHS